MSSHEWDSQTGACLASLAGSAAHRAAGPAAWLGELSSTSQGAGEMLWVSDLLLVQVLALYL